MKVTYNHHCHCLYISVSYLQTVVLSCFSHLRKEVVVCKYFLKRKNVQKYNKYQHFYDDLLFDLNPF